MVKLEYVRKRIFRKIIALVAGIGSTVIATFSIISFLGQRTGSFTVTIENNEVNLTLLTSSTSDDYTSFLRVDELETMRLYCFQNFKTLDGDIDFSTIDNETSPCSIGADYDDNGDITAYKFFKYTYYVKNIGSNTAKYTMNVNLISNTADTKTQKKLDTFLRAVVFEDGNYTVFAKRSNDATHYDTEKPDEKTTLEYVDGDPDRPSIYEGLAEPFISSSTLAKYTQSDFEPDEMIRYTLLFWLEGDDAEATGFAPEDCKLRLGVEIQAYEN